VRHLLGLEWSPESMSPIWFYGLTPVDDIIFSSYLAGQSS
jgi:hypothetical protein